MFAHRRPKLRPRSAAPSYMRATFAVNSAMPTFARPTSNHVRHRPGYVLRPGSSEEVTANGAAKYVLEEGFHQGNRMCSPVGHPWWQGFGVRTATGGNDGSDGGKEGVQQKARCASYTPEYALLRRLTLVACPNSVEILCKAYSDRNCATAWKANVRHFDHHFTRKNCLL